MNPSILSPEAKADLIARLIAHVVSECNEIDIAARYDEVLNECYDLSKVGGPFSHMDASRVLRGVDPIAYRCGMNDYTAGLDELVEIEGNYYETDCVERARISFADGLSIDLDDAEAGLRAEENDDSPTNVFACRAEVARLQESILVVGNHSF